LYFDDFIIKGASALGKRISTRVVRQVNELIGKASEQKPGEENDFHNDEAPEADSSVQEEARTVTLNKKDITQLGLFDPKPKS
jgi:uncharacterized protein (DUF1778 family)